LEANTFSRETNPDFECVYQGTLIPTGETIERFDLKGDISWVLVVEKEVFTAGRFLQEMLTWFSF
jgi:hypothetical protein